MVLHQPIVKISESVVDASLRRPGRLDGLSVTAVHKKL
jgi:hypothetical protein